MRVFIATLLHVHCTFVLFSFSKRRAELTFGHPEALLCTFVGRISKEKRIDVLLDAVRYSAKRGFAPCRGAGGGCLTGSLPTSRNTHFV